MYNKFIKISLLCVEYGDLPLQDSEIKDFIKIISTGSNSNNSILETVVLQLNQENFPSTNISLVRTELDCLKRLLFGRNM